jgi:hypothetical protein
MPRHASGYKLWDRKDSPWIWARATIRGKRWAQAAAVPRGGDRERANSEAAALYVEACRAAGAAGQGVALPAEILAHLDLTKLVADFLAREEETYTGHDDRHHDRYASDLNCHVLTRWKRVEEITSDEWQRARRELHKRNGGPLGHRSIAHLANTLRHFLRYCHELGVIRSVPEIESPSTKEQRSEQAARSAMTAQQRDAFLKALLQLGEDRAHRIFTTMFWSLLRQNEAGALTPRWVHWKAEKITVPAEHSKSGEVEEIDLHPLVRKAAARRSARAREEEDRPRRADLRTLRLPPGEHAGAARRAVRPRLP